MDEFSITAAEAGGFLRVTLHGHATRNSLIAALHRIKAETKSKDLWRVLVDATALPFVPGTLDKFEIGIEFARIAERRMIMAVVGRPEAVDHFFETVARNRGGLVRVFTDEAAALGWLLGTPGN